MHQNPFLDNFHVYLFIYLFIYFLSYKYTNTVVENGWKSKIHILKFKFGFPNQMHPECFSMYIDLVTC